MPSGKSLKGALWRPVLLSLVVVLCGCEPMAENANLEANSTQALEYYPHLVKGYQNSYPQRRIVILNPGDDRKISSEAGDNQQPQTEGGNIPIGVTLDQSGAVLQHLYSAPLRPMIRKSLQDAAQEAGLLVETMDEEGPRRSHADYVMNSRITKCWVKKQRGSDTRFGPTWQTVAEVSLVAEIYKPPFKVPFWQGSSESSYSDPPPASALSPADQTGIYDEPGQVLSIAITRAVAGFFKRDDLRTLINEDHTEDHRHAR